MTDGEDLYYDDPYCPTKGATIWTDEAETLSVYAVKDGLEIEYQYPNYSDVDNSLATCEEYMGITIRDDIDSLRTACQDLYSHIMINGIDRDERLVLLNSKTSVILLNVSPDNEYWEIGLFRLSYCAGRTSYSGLFDPVDDDRPFLLVEDESGHYLMDFLDGVAEECDKALRYEEASQ